MFQFDLCRVRGLDRLYVYGRRALLALLYVKLHLLTFGQRPETSTLDGGEMDEYVLATVLGGNEAEALGFVEPLDCSCNHERYLYTVVDLPDRVVRSEYMCYGRDDQLLAGGTSELITGTGPHGCHYTQFPLKHHNFFAVRVSWESRRRQWRTIAMSRRVAQSGCYYSLARSLRPEQIAGLVHTPHLPKPADEAPAFLDRGHQIGHIHAWK